MVFFAKDAKHMIRIQHLTKTFNSGSPNALKALDDINLHIRPEDFLVIVGSNGSGKSTLGMCLLRLQECAGGLGQ